MRGYIDGQRAASTLCTMLSLTVSLLCVAAVSGTADVMKDVTLGFGEALKHCREESELTEEMMEEFFHFWRDDFKFEHRELGCAIRCMSHHFHIMTEDHRMHHQKTDAFIKTFPNGEVLAEQMVGMIHACELQFEHEADHCWRILHTAECFKNTSVARGLAPAMQLAMAELLMEADGL